MIPPKKLSHEERRALYENIAEDRSKDYREFVGEIEPAIPEDLNKAYRDSYNAGVVESSSVIEEYSSILQEAYKITSSDRNDQYGEAEDCFDKIAAYWNTYLGSKDLVRGKDVANMMALLKIAREGYKHKRDNLVDAAGYLRLSSKLQGDENGKSS